MPHTLTTLTLYLLLAYVSYCLSVALCNTVTEVRGWYLTAAAEYPERHMVSRGAPSYAMLLDAMDSAACGGVHADWLPVLESLSATRNKCGGKAYRPWVCRMKKTGELSLQNWSSVVYKRWG